uniref:WAT1-related protein n=1 Tax=Rhizophora mucronata TaxID=61149 RepID=A0A2P2JFN3_RHIMU
MKEYPAEFTVVFFYNLSVSIIAAIVALLTEGTSNAWIVRPNIALASILCSGLLGCCLNNTIHTWALHLKGPLFVAMFKPLSIAIAVAMGVMFLGDTLHLGSLIGATIIAVGFYTVMWGKAKEDQVQGSGSGSSERQSSLKSPLLQTHKNEEV